MKQKEKYVLKSEKSESVMQTPRTPHKNALFKKSKLRHSLQFSFDTPEAVETYPIIEKSYKIIYQNEFIFTEINDNYFETTYNIIEKIGEGDYYDVYIVSKAGTNCHNSERCVESTNKPSNNLNYCKCSGEFTCVKISKKYYTGEGNKKIRLKEIEILNALKGMNNIVQIIGSWEERGRLYLETEMCGFGNLKDLINHVYSVDQNRFGLEMIKKIISEIAFGLKSIHEANIVHMDIKPENIFIQSVKNIKCDGTCKCALNDDLNNFRFVIGDFNISKYNTDEIHDDGDKKYMPGEILLNQAYYSSDIFSLGLIFLEIALGIVLPATGEDWLNLRKNNFKDLKFKKINVKMKNIIIKMIDKDPFKRPSARDVIKLVSIL